MNLPAGVASYREGDDTVRIRSRSAYKVRLTATGQPPDHIHLPQPGKSYV